MFRAEERERRRRENNHEANIADGMAEDGLDNPIVVPSKVFNANATSDNLTHPK